MNFTRIHRVSRGMMTGIVISAFALSSVSTGYAQNTSGNAQSTQVDSQVTTIPAGRMVRVVLLRALDSTTMDVGDKVRVQIAPDDPSGIPKNFVMVGRVTEVAPATKTAPGVIDIHFGALERPGGGWSGVSIDLAIGKQPPVDETGNLAVSGKATKQINAKIIGYSAGAGAVLGTLFKSNGRSFVKGGLLGALAGTIASERTRNTTETTTYTDVKLKAGTELTVTLNRPITVSSTVIVQ